MAYRNARDIFPEKLLKQIQKYVAGETIYIPAGVEKKDWGETSGYQQYIRERNAAIRTAFREGTTIEALTDEYSLSYDTIKRIVYSKKEVTMLKYSATLESAMEYGREEKMDAWVHLYLNEEGRNIPFSDGLKLFDRYFISPAQFPISLFHRCAGPEEDMRYRIDKGWWEHKISELTKAVQAGTEMPPMIVHYVDGEFELNDGNHRHKVYEDLGIETAWVILWITEEEELNDFMSKYGEYVKDCVIVRR